MIVEEDAPIKGSKIKKALKVESKEGGKAKEIKVTTTIVKKEKKNGK